MKSERRGGYFKVRAYAWEPEHYKAAWSPENRAPEWWAEIDVAWQHDHGTLMSVRKLQTHLGWKKHEVERLLALFRDDLDRWEGRTKPGQKPDNAGTPARTDTGQSDQEEPGEVNQKPDTSRTETGRKSDTSRTPRARPIPKPDSDPDSDPDNTHTPPPAGVCVSDPESEGNPEPEPKGPTPLDLVRDWHAFIGRQCPENPSGLDLAGETIAKHGERAWEAVVQATHKLKASKMLPTTMYFGGLRAPLAQVVLPAAAPKQTPAPEPPPEAVEAFDEPDRQRAEDAWREALEARIGAQNMEIWMHHVRVALVSPQLVRLEMESRYYLDWIEDNLGRELAAVWAEVLGTKPMVVMGVAPVRPALRVVRREEPDPAPEPPRVYPPPATDSRAVQIC